MEAIDYLSTSKIGYQVTLDPVGVFGNIERQKLLDSCGALPGIMTCAAINDIALIDALRLYEPRAGLTDDDGVEIGERGEFEFQDDPATYPWIRIETKEEIFYQYPLNWVAVVNKATGKVLAQPVKFEEKHQ